MAWRVVDDECTNAGLDDIDRKVEDVYHQDCEDDRNICHRVGLR